MTSATDGDNRENPQRNDDSSLISMRRLLITLRDFIIISVAIITLIVSYVLVALDHGPAYLKYAWMVLTGYNAKTGFSYYEISTTGAPTRDGRFKVIGANGIVKLEDIKSDMILKATDFVNIRSDGNRKNGKLIGIILVDTCVIVNGATKYPVQTKDPEVLSGGWIMVKKHDCPS